MKNLSFLFFISFLIISCEDDKVSTGDKKDPIETGVNEVTLEDIGNAGNGNDLRVSFQGVSDETQVVEYRIMIRINDDDPDLQLSEAENIPNENYTSVPVLGPYYSIQLSPITKDIAGNLIGNGVDYHAFVFTEVNKKIIDTNFISQASNTISLSSKTGLTSNIFADDVNNKQDATDIRIAFDNASNEDIISEYRLYIIKKSAIAVLESQNDVLNLSSDKYVSVDKIGGPITLRLDNEATDTDGEPLTPNLDYVIVVGTMANGTSSTESVLNIDYSEFSIRINNYIETITNVLPIGTGGLIFRNDGVLFASDFGDNINTADGKGIYQIDEFGVSTLWKEKFNGPVGMKFDANNNLYVVNFEENTVVKISEEGPDLQFGFSATGINKPMDVYYESSDETIYVTNSGSDTIYHIDQDLESTIFYDNSDHLLYGSNGITKDNSGNFYITNFKNGNIIKISPDTTATIFAHIQSSGLGHILFDQDRFFVTSRLTHEIFKVDLEGTVTRFAGTGNSSNLDGSALKSNILLPFGLAISPDRKYLYFNVVSSAEDFNKLRPSIIKRIVLDEDFQD